MFVERTKKDMSATYTYWQDPKDGLFVGYWNDYPDYQTEGYTLEELRRMLVSLRNDIVAMVVDGTMECSHLHVGEMALV